MPEPVGAQRLQRGADAIGAGKFSHVAVEQSRVLRGSERGAVLLDWSGLLVAPSQGGW